MNKKKAFISQPMSGKKEREIIEDRLNILEELTHFAIYEKDIEVINTYIKDEPPADSNVRLWIQKPAGEKSQYPQVGMPRLRSEARPRHERGNKYT